MTNDNDSHSKPLAGTDKPTALPHPVAKLAWNICRALASAQLTSVLLMLAIGIVVVGTLAQVHDDIWAVIDRYFRAWGCWIDVKMLLPPSFFPWAADVSWDSLAIQRIPFPGGASIGLALAINLAAAHTMRFKMQVRGMRLFTGLVVLALGIVTTWWVVAAGHNREGLQGQPILEWSTLWWLIQIGLEVLLLACLVAFVYLWLFVKRPRGVELGILGASMLGLGLVLAWIFVKGEAATLTDSSLRILYQLIQGQIAAGVLLLACILLFQKRAGIALLHGGVGLLMFGEFFVSYYAVEQQMTIGEGQTINYARDIRSVELVIRTLSRDGPAQVVAISLSTNGRLTGYANGNVIQEDDLPFEIQLLRYFRNVKVRQATPGDSNLANQGFGRGFIAEEAPVRSSVQGGDVDLAAAYVKFTNKADGKELGTYLLSQVLPPETIAAGEQGYGLAMRFQQDNKPYQITLLDVRKDDHVGTSMAKNYASRVRLQDPTRNVDFETTIWMNNPLRYAGETFYQSGYNVDRQGKETSTFQVVRNTGWMIPYVACMIAATGMLAHFFVVLVRFLRRIRDGVTGSGKSVEPAMVPARERAPETRRPSAMARFLVPGAIAVLSLGWIGSKAMPPRDRAGQMELQEFGELPVVFEGRVKPFDTLARNSLRILSNRETFVDANDQRQPAIRWLLDVIARPDVADQHRIFRIDSLELLETFGLQRRPGFRYSWEELRPQWMEFQRQGALAQQQPAAKRTFQQRKLLESAQRFFRYRLLTDAFRPVQVPPPSDGATDTAAKDRLSLQIRSANEMLTTMQLPLAAPVGPPQQPWEAYAVAKNAAYLEQQASGREPPPVLSQLTAMFAAYEQGDAATFNQAVADYGKSLTESPPSGLDLRMTHFEAYFNHFAPFYNSIPLYALALILTAFAWLAAAASPRLSSLLRNSAFWLIVITFAVHTFALAARVMISGRPPVTNLYSSAVFIGWGCVLLGLCLEMVFRVGIGNFVSSAAGIGTLIIAHFLAGDGDTIRVLQAVLDTQFWLTTHVLTVTLGYSATFLAGMLGIVTLGWLCGKVVLFDLDFVAGLFVRRRLERTWLSTRCADVERILASMTYGAICFAVFFSFVGTVLGGLWADDSWGRFWGWDPKENGALIVVLWNTIVLHAYWAHMVRHRGLAVLAIVGNIITAWSWFGVNELGIGLHSYGFTEGVARALLLFWISQSIVIAVGLVVIFAARILGGPPEEDPEAA